MNNEKDKIEDKVEDVLLETNIADKNKKIKKKIDIFSNLQGKFIQIKVGNNDRPSTDEEINELQNKFDKYMKENEIDCITFVTHHAVEIKVIV